MPQESAGRPERRAPALALLVGLALLLVAHVVSCALHPADAHSHTVAETMAMTSAVPSAVGVVPPLGSDAAASSADRDAGEHPGHGTGCCDPADRPADLRASTAALLLALLLLVLARTGRAGAPLLPSAPPGGAGPEPPSASGGLPLLRLVCVSRT
ncbi:hypothetical protein SRB17_19720 [Streptomyces sp. RB17]|uniref:hypothetical protein n=1 Tax=Streptomyces sp. RB17 TaxID=2585197 RepID=UPI0012972207|nr:hypothetical protein [Streptomyces sp. RB17]MQY34006.1 hypothetical protein [Streptomyces sp. RB17]